MKSFVLWIALGAVFAGTTLPAFGQSLDEKLVKAVTAGDKATVADLLSSRANPLARDAEKRTALAIAAKAGHTGILNLLLDYGATSDEGTRTESLLARAIEWKNPSVVQALVDAGAQAHATLPGKGSLLHIAVAAGDAEIVRILLDSGARPDGLDETHRTALMLAAGRGDQKVASLLLDYGTDARLKDKAGKSALGAAQAGDHKATVKLLTSHLASLKPGKPADDDSILKPEPGADLLKISQQAKDNATIVLKAGEYKGTLYVKGKSLKVYGATDGETVIAEGAEGKHPPVLVVDGGTMTLTNVKFARIPADQAAVVVSGGSATLHGCTFSETPTTAFHVEKGKAVLRSCKFESLAHVGIIVTSRSTLLIEDSTFERCDETAIHVQSESRLRARRCRFEEIKNDAVVALGKSSLEVSDSQFEKVGRNAISSQGSPETAVRRCHFTDLLRGVTVRGTGRLAVQHNRFKQIREKGVAVNAGTTGPVLVTNNILEACDDGVNIRGERAQPATIARNTFVGVSGAVYAETKSSGTRPSVRVYQNSIVHTDPYGVLLEKNTRAVLIGNTIVGGKGMAVSIQRGSQVLLSANLISAPEAALNFFESPAEKSWLCYDVILGKIKSGKKDPFTFPATRRLNTAVTLTHAGPQLIGAVQEVVSANKTLEQMRKPYGRMHGFWSAVMEEASNVAPAELFIEDRVGKRVRDQFTVYDGSSPIVGAANVVPQNFKKPGRLAALILKAADGVSAHIQKTSAEKTGTLLKAHDPSKPVSNDLLEALTDELNRIIDGPLFYEKERFEPFPPDGELMAWIARLQSLSEEDRARPENADQIRQANRDLLELAYPAALAPRGPIVQSEEARAFLPRGTYWLVGNANPTWKKRVTIESGSTVKALIKLEEGQWVTMREGKEAKPYPVMFVPRPQSEVQDFVSSIRSPGALWDSFALRKSTARPEDLARARKLALDHLELALGPQPEDYERQWAANDHVQRMLAVAGRPEDAGAIYEACEKHKVKLWKKIGWAAVMAAIESYHGKLSNGRLAALVKGSNPEWAVVAAIQLHRYGLTIGDDVLRNFIETTSDFGTAATVAKVLLDSTDPKTLPAMRTLLKRYLKAAPEEIQTYQSYKNPSIHAALYLLAYGEESDLKRVGGFEMGSGHAFWLSLLSQDPMPMARIVVRKSGEMQTARMGIGFLHRGLPEAKVYYSRLLHAMAAHHARMRPKRDIRDPDPYSVSLNTNNIRCSYYMPNRTAIQFYGPFGNTWAYEPKMNDRQFPSMHRETTWFAEPRFLDRYVGWWFEKNRYFEHQLDYVDLDTIAKAVAKKGGEKRPVAYDLIMASLRVSTRAWCHAYDFLPTGLERRAYMMRHKHGNAGGLSGVADMRFHWVDSTLRIELRLRHEGYFSRGMIDADPAQAYPHYKYLIDGGRALVKNVILKKDQKKVEATFRGLSDEGFLVWEAKLPKRDLSGWYAHANMDYVGQPFTLSYRLFAGESARRIRLLEAEIAGLARTVKARPDDVDAARYYAYALQDAGRLTAAWAAFQKAAALDPRDDTLWQDASDMFGSAGMTERALEVLERATGQFPTNRSFVEQLGGLLYRLERYAEAAARLEPIAAEDARVALARATYLHLAGKAAQAESIYAKLSNGPDRVRVLTLRYINAHSRDGVDPAAADAAIQASTEARQIGLLLGKITPEAALKEGPKSEQACTIHWLAGYRYLIEKNTAAAKGHFQKAAELGGSDQLEARLAQQELKKLSGE